MKGKSKRIVSGFLSALTIISSIMQPVTTYAAEAEPAAYEAEYPDMEKVKGALAEDEIVTAEDYEVEAGTGFDVKSDFSGMKIHPEKVKVTYHEAKNQNGQAFDGNKADTYHAVYFVEPVSGHPSYHVQRNIVVREPSAEIHKEKNAQDSDGNDQTGGEDAEEGETDSHKKKLSETELNQALEALKGQDTYDEESGLKLLDVMEQFKNHMIAGNVDLLALEEGETVTFTAYNPKMLRSSQVEVSSGGWYYYADYGLGSYLTCPFTVKFGSVTATAYCIQPSKPGPGSGVYEITKLGDGKELSKVCYYGTNASGEDCFFDKKYPDFSAGKRFVVTHLAASYVVEKETADGFVLDGEPRDIDLTYRDQDTPVVTFDSEWQNSRQKAKVIVTKKEKDSDRVLEGGVFALCAKEDIKNTDGDVLVKADTIMEQKATDKDGKIFFTADLPVGGSFYVKEVKAPAGFVTTEEVKEFTFEYAGADVPEVTFEHTFENEATIFEITKSDLTTGEELPGAKLEVTDQDGTVVDEWTSGTEPHIIKELEVGKEYTLTETLPADGYVTAESITFTVENTAEVQKVEMKDDVTKVEISKTDISGKELPGAKMTVLDKDGNAVESWTSTDKPHYMEKLPIGDYILREETAPEGYLIAEDVEFSVKDTGEIQKVSMKDEKKPSETPQTPQEPSKPTDTPKTGDDSNIRLWLLLAGLALCGTGGSLFLLKKKK